VAIVAALMCPVATPSLLNPSSSLLENPSIAILSDIKQISSIQIEFAGIRGLLCVVIDLIESFLWIHLELLYSSPELLGLTVERIGGCSRLFGT